MPAEITAAAHEYLYRYLPPWEDSEGSWHAHRVVRRTKKRVFIRRRHLRLDEMDNAERQAWADRVWPGTPADYSLDRLELEATGETSIGKGWGRQTFYTRPQDFGPARVAPTRLTKPLEVLGLEWPVTEDALRSAYRERSKVAHPDVGGSDERFREVREAFETLLPVAR